jgi:hypothetical protein
MEFEDVRISAPFGAANPRTSWPVLLAPGRNPDLYVRSRDLIIFKTMDLRGRDLRPHL